MPSPPGKIVAPKVVGKPVDRLAGKVVDAAQQIHAGQQLKAIRQQLGMDQATLAKQAKLDLKTIQAMEKIGNLLEVGPQTLENFFVVCQAMHARVACFSQSPENNSLNIQLEIDLEPYSLISSPITKETPPWLDKK